jgi:hypothetical protein
MFSPFPKAYRNILSRVGIYTSAELRGGDHSWCLMHSQQVVPDRPSH